MLKNVCRKENIAKHGENHTGLCHSSLQYLPLVFTSSIFSFWIHLLGCQMLTLSDLNTLFQDHQGSTVSGCLFKSLIQSDCTKQSDLSTIGQDRIPPGVWAIVSHQAAVTWRGVFCLSRMAATEWVMTQHQDLVSTL